MFYNNVVIIESGKKIYRNLPTTVYKLPKTAVSCGFFVVGKKFQPTTYRLHFFLCSVKKKYVQCKIKAL